VGIGKTQALSVYSAIDKASQDSSGPEKKSTRALLK
jgi:hypothetical protein